MSSSPGINQSAVVGTALREYLSGSGFSCVGAKMALKRGTLRHHHYGRLASAEDSQQLYADLRWFAKHRESVDPHFATFVATFGTPVDTDEHQFEDLLWLQLQLLHQLDGDAPTWHPNFDPSPTSDRFGFCLAGHPFFIVGMHAEASRHSRRFPYPTLAFNSHEQFERLHHMGVFRRLRSEIRRREVALQGTVNPSFIDYPGHEARQYAGRYTETDWRCPFHARPTPTTGAPPRHQADATTPSRQVHLLPPDVRQVRCAQTQLVLLWEATTTSLLDLCEEYDVPVDSACRAGVCGNCAVPLMSGTAEYQVDPIAEPSPGHILLCIAEPTSDIELDL